jgi:geranylgeranyl pyrophosphate synthase
MIDTSGVQAEIENLASRAVKTSEWLDNCAASFIVEHRQLYDLLHDQILDMASLRSTLEDILFISEGK